MQHMTENVMLKILYAFNTLYIIILCKIFNIRKLKPICLGFRISKKNAIKGTFELCINCVLQKLILPIA